MMGSHREHFVQSWLFFHPHILKEIQWKLEEVQRNAARRVKGTKWFAHKEQLNALECFSLENRRSGRGGKGLTVRNQEITSSIERVSRKCPFTASSSARCGAPIW